MLQLGRDWIAWVAGGSLLISGCSWMPSRESSWPSLPSLVHGEANDAAAIAATIGDRQGRRIAPVIDNKTAAAKPRTSTNGRATKEDGSIAMAMLNGMNHERSGDWAKAREVYEEIRKRNPENAEAAHRLGIVADNQRRCGRAALSVRIEREPRNTALLADLGYCYYLQGQLPKAGKRAGQGDEARPVEPPLLEQFRAHRWAPAALRRGARLLPQVRLRSRRPIQCGLHLRGARSRRRRQTQLPTGLELRPHAPQGAGRSPLLVRRIPNGCPPISAT